MNHMLRPAIALLAVLAATSTSQSQIVINEIMSRPGTAFPENTALEFVEFHNPTGASVNVSGWAITSGTSYTIPNGTSIPPGGFLVVAANVSALETVYGPIDAIGPWLAGSALANSGEKITLSKPGLQPGTWDTVDSVTYATEGDWGTRVREPAFGGWDWTSAAESGGKSLEVRNPAISNDNGQNWLPSTAALGGTPGAANTAFVADVAPIIHDVKHSPAVPASTQDVTISCQVTDETAPAGLSATLFYRDASSGTPGAFQQLAMGGDGAGKFSALLGPRPNLTIMEFYVAVSDGTNTRTWPAPTSEGQNANCQYLVSNEVLGSDGYYFLVLTAAENAAFTGVNSQSDRVFNQTFIVRNGADTTIRYRSGMRIRGNSSRTYQFRPLRITIPNDNAFDGSTSFNLAPRAPHLQFLSQRLLQAAGIRASDAIPVELRRNGAEQTTSTGGTPDFGKWARIEDEGGAFVKNHWPAGQDTGNFYKKIDNGAAFNYYWRSAGWTVPSDPNTLMDGYSKQGNSSANDWTDLTSFFTVMQAAAAPHFPSSSSTDVAGSNGTRQSGIGNWNGTAFTPTEMTSIETVADLDQWARWFAAMTILQSIETNISNGVDDDYGVYFIPVGAQRKMQLVAHDLDTTFGLGDSPQAFNYTGLHDMTEGGQSGFGFKTLLPLFGTAATAGNAAFIAKYHTAIRELYGTTFDASTAGNPNPPFYQFVDSHLAGWVPAATMDAIKAFATQRQGYLLDLIPDGVVGGSVATPLTPAAATSTGTIFSEHPHALIISEILASNVAAVNVGGAFPDIIEIRNTGAASEDLSGMTLSDDATVAKYTFPAGTTLAGGGYLLLYADGGTAAGHVPFSIENGGESLYLRASAAGGGAILDSVTFGHLPPDYTLGRTGAGAEDWTLCTPTLGGANSAVTTFGAPGGLRINEWAGRRDYLIEDDFMEIYNPAALPVALGGMRITDNPINSPAKHTLPTLSFVAPLSFTHFKAKGGSATPSNSTELPFSMDANFGTIAIFGQNGTLVDRQDIIAHAADTSRGLSPDGGTTVTTYGLPATIPTPGASNVAPPPGVLALLNGLRITEVLYHPATLEFVELHNIGATTLDLAGVRFSRGLTYTFPPGTTLATGAYIVVCRDRAAFSAQFPAAVPFLAPGFFTGSLDNAGETIAFQPPSPHDVNILKFEYKPTWFAPLTDTGYSLTVIDDVATPARDWGDKSTWTTSTGLYGTPGAGPPPTVTSASIATGVLNDPFSYQITATQVPTSYGATGLPAGVTVNTTSGLVSGTPTVNGTFDVIVSATNAGGTGMKSVTFSIATSGPVASFVWSAIPSPQSNGAPFPATLTAKDAQGRTVTALNGSVPISGQGAGVTAGIILITETGSAQNDYFEIENVGNAVANTAGWFIVPNNGGGAGGGVNTATAPWPLPATIAPGQVIAVTENSAGIYPQPLEFGSGFGGGSASAWVMLRDNTGALRDFVAWGYNAAQISSINVPSVTVAGTTYTNLTVPAAHWSGGGIPLSGFNLVRARTGTADNNTSADWTYLTGGGAESNKGLHNANLTTPFIPPPATIPIAPTTVTLVNGVFAGNITANQVTTGMKLIANDGAGHTGETNTFDVSAAPPPVITSHTAAIGVAGSPFSYQITATNSPTSYSSTALPSGVTLNPATGLISGTPGSFSLTNVTITATNAGGSGNRVVTLEIDQDSDGDGMGDGWEANNGLDDGSNDALLDFDGDGQNNVSEWIAQTIPSDSNSWFRITSTTLTGGNIVLTWNAVPGKRYRVHHRTNLTAGNWAEVTPAPIVATTTSGTFSHAAGTRGFYQVSVER
jgi:Lamin Tail Domain/Putative Ig domain